MPEPHHTVTALHDNQPMPEHACTASPPSPQGCPAASPANPQKNRQGLKRVWHAFGYSVAGLRAGWQETAFRQEAIASLVLLPAAAWLGRGWVETALLAGSVVLVMIVELLNTGIETAIDRIGPEWHDLSKRAKDMGSAAVLLSLLLCAGVWALALFQRFFA
jgi:diacylglycerol kinase (ATP)